MTRVSDEWQFDKNDEAQRIFGPCDDERNRKWRVELDFDLAGFSVGVPPITWGFSDNVELVDQYAHANPDNLLGPAIIKNISGHLGWGYGHTEYSIGWAEGTGSGWGWGGLGASFDVLAGRSYLVKKNEVCCDYEEED